MKDCGIHKNWRPATPRKLLHIVGISEALRFAQDRRAVQSEYRRVMCKYHTSNDVFAVQVCTMDTGKSDDELIHSDNKMRIGTRSGKFIILD